MFLTPMNCSKIFYSAPECKLRFLKLERCVLTGSLQDDHNMDPFSGDNDTAGDHDGGIGGNNYDL
jgi:hypothetical protein